jgi:hypothetical protein
MHYADFFSEEVNTILEAEIDRINAARKKERLLKQKAELQTLDITKKLAEIDSEIADIDRR